MSDKKATLKFWIAMGEDPAYNRDNHHLFHVFLDGQPGFSGHPLQHKFISAVDLNEARMKLHAYVDEFANHMVHMNSLEKAVEKSIEDKKPKFPTELSITDIGDDVQNAGDISAETSEIFKDLEDLKGV